MYQRKKINSFTLIEILIVLALLSFLSGIFLRYSGKILEQHRFDSAVEQLRNELFITKLLSKNYQIDVTLALESNPKGLILRRLTDEPFSKKNPLFLSIKLPGLSLGENIETVLIHYWSNGYIESLDDFNVFSTSNKKMQQTIYKSFLFSFL